MNPGKCRNPEQLQIQTERREDGKREKRGWEVPEEKKGRKKYNEKETCVDKALYSAGSEYSSGCRVSDGNPGTALAETAAGTGMKTINDAIKDGETNIVLQADVTENVVIPKDKSVTIDLNGFTLTNNWDQWKNTHYYQQWYPYSCR